MGVVVGGNEIHIVDPTGFAAMSIGVSNLAKTLSVAINSKISDSQNSNENGQYWTKVFGSEFKKDSKGQNFAYDHDYDGAIIGYEYEKNFGLIVGLSSGEINTKAQSFKSNVKSVFIGGYKGLEIAESVFLNTNFWLPKSTVKPLLTTQKPSII